MGRTAFIFPGQGSQYVGMGRPLWERSQEVRDLYETASRTAGFDVAAASFEGPADVLDSDITAQVAVFVCNEACRMAAMEEGLVPDVVTGYSLGFYSALVSAGTLSFMDALRAVLRAGELALAAGEGTRGGMGAIIGLTLDEVEGICRNTGGFYVSNINAATQILVSGVAEGVRRAVGEAVRAGALSAFELNMGAAYHSPVMEPTLGPFGEYLSGTAFNDPGIPVVSYLDAAEIKTGGEAAEVVRTQLARRVMWKETVNGMAASGADVFVEAGPGNALSRMVRWINRDVSVRPVEDILGIAASEGVRRP